MRFTFAVVCLLGFVSANRLVGEPGTEKTVPVVETSPTVPELVAKTEASYKKVVDDVDASIKVKQEQNAVATQVKKVADDFAASK